MALTNLGWTFNVSLVDSGGNKASKKYVLVAADYAAASAAAATITAALQGVTAAVITGTRLVETVKEDAVVYAAAGVEVENRALISGQASVDAKIVTLDIPAPLDSIFVNTVGVGRNILDIAHAAVLAYCNLFDSGASVCSLSDGDFLGNIIKGIRMHRASRKG